MVNRERTEEQQVDSIMDMDPQNADSLEEEAPNMANEESIDMLNPGDLYDTYTDDIYKNIEELSLPEHKDFDPLSDSDRGMQDSASSASGEYDPDTAEDIVIFDQDAEPEMLDEQEFQLKNQLLHKVEEARTLENAIALDDLGKSILK